MDTMLDEEIAKGKPSVRYAWRWLQDFKEEFKKISWTSSKELRISTKVVVASIFVFGFGIYLVDLLVKGVLHGISIAFRVVFG